MRLLLSLGHRFPASAEHSSIRRPLLLPRASTRSPRRSYFKHAIVWLECWNDKGDEPWLKPPRI